MIVFESEVGLTTMRVAESLMSDAISLRLLIVADWTTLPKCTKAKNREILLTHIISRSRLVYYKKENGPMRNLTRVQEFSG